MSKKQEPKKQEPKAAEERRASAKAVIPPDFEPRASAKPKPEGADE